MTTTEKKTKTDETTEAPKKGGTPKSSAASPATSDAGYEAIFRNWELVGVEDGFVNIKKPAEVVCIFDVRATPPTKIDTLIETTKKGINSPIRVTQMRFKGETGDYAVHPEPGKKVRLKTGEIYTVSVFGRQRNRAAIANGLELPATIKQYAHWADMVKDAFDENESREPMGQWDRACMMRNLHDAGKTQEQIAAIVAPKVSAGNISHHLAVFHLPPPVQKLFRDGNLTPTFIRHIRQLRQDPDLATKVSMLCVEKAWSEEDLKKYIQLVLNPQPKEGKKDGKKPAKKLERVSFDSIPLKAMPVKQARLMLSNADLFAREADRKAKEVKKDKEADPKKLLRIATRAAFLEGVKQGALYALGGETPPDEFLAEIVEEQDEDEGDEGGEE